MKHIKKLIGLGLLLAQGTSSCAANYLERELAELQALKQALQEKAAVLGIEIEIIDELANQVKKIDEDAILLDFLSKEEDTLSGRSVTEKQPLAVKTPATTFDLKRKSNEPGNNCNKLPKQQLPASTRNPMPTAKNSNDDFDDVLKEWDGQWLLNPPERKLPENGYYGPGRVPKEEWLK